MQLLLRILSRKSFYQFIPTYQLSATLSFERWSFEPDRLSSTTIVNFKVLRKQFSVFQRQRRRFQRRHLLLFQGHRDRTENGTTRGFPKQNRSAILTNHSSHAARQRRAHTAMDPRDL